ncbi:Pentatricopeptide repeat, partial [Thalictrum thalictroides]
MNLYSKCGDIKAAYQLFDEVPSENIVNWNTMIAGFLVCGDIGKARELFDQMPERNVESWNVLISGYSKCGLLEAARSLFDQMPKRDLFSWSVMISDYAQCRRAAEALELFKEMVNVGLRPDVVLLSSVLSACGQIGALEMGKWIHSYVDRNSLKYDVFLGTSLIDMYAKCGCINVALQVFHNMSNKNACTWNAIICGLAMHGYGANVLELYKDMESAHVKPNDVTFVGVLSACCHIGSVDEGRRQFNRMTKDFHIIPKIEHYGCMVDILGRAGLIDEAKDLITSMPMEPNIVVLGAFLGACKLHGFTNVGDDVVRHLQNIAPGDGGCYVLLSNIYADENQWDKVAKMRKLMKQRGIEKKTPGCSSIEVNSVVHEFVVDDKLHMNWREIYLIIDRLRTHVEVE